ncbi:MAG: TraR/DksA C4-type zinc finger protein [Actinobacteria bacterium]|nr:TraR/DksA C4-type zinc finger protein [Actinomycetota bacterium]
MNNQQIRKRLVDERYRLESVRMDYRDEYASEGPPETASGELSSVDQHPADEATETLEREQDESILDQFEGELKDIDRALERLDEGTYGTCEVCGKPIGDERLDAMPAARLCIDDQAKAERNGRPAP